RTEPRPQADPARRFLCDRTGGGVERRRSGGRLLDRGLLDRDLLDQGAGTSHICALERMMTAAEPFFLTTPIYYVNDLPHIGHAYTTVACDVLARFMRLDGRRVTFSTGSDEHGQKVEQSAHAAGVSAQEFCDRISPAWREMTRLLNISNDDFIRTTEPRHIRGVEALWQELERRGEIYLGRFAGWYAVRDEAFY